MADETTTTTTDSNTQQPATTIGTGTQNADPAAFTPEQQKRIDNIMGNTRKESKAAALADLAKELGYDSVDDMKTAAAEAKKQKDAETPEIERLRKELEKEKAAREEAETKRAAAEAKRRADYVDGRIETLARDAKAIDAAEVAEHCRSKRAEEIDALYSEDGKFNEEKAKKLIEDIKKAKAHWFKSASGVSSPSVSGGRPLQPDADMNKAALSKLRSSIRNS